MSKDGQFLSATRNEARAHVSRALARAGVLEHAQEAECLMLWALRIDRLALFCDGAVHIEIVENERLEGALARRLAGEPITRIMGRRGFWTLDLEVRPNVLDPRADSESVIEAALRYFTSSGTTPQRIADLGCGSGALLCALLAEFPLSVGFGFDCSHAAIAAARANLCANGFFARAALVCGSWLEAVGQRLEDKRFDLIVSNPPYIASADIAHLEIGVRGYDPILALDGGPDGLDAYRALLPQAACRLNPMGCLVLEIGAGQSADVAALAKSCGFRLHLQQSDLNGRVRALVFISR